MKKLINATGDVVGDALDGVTWARLGRSSYLGDRVLGRPDPGAQAVALWLSALAAVFGE